MKTLSNENEIYSTQKTKVVYLKGVQLLVFCKCVARNVNIGLKNRTQCNNIFHVFFVACSYLYFLFSEIVKNKLINTRREAFQGHVLSVKLFTSNEAVI